MHVLHIIDSLHGGGAETSLVEVVPGLRSRGVRISIATLFPDDGVFDEQLKELGVVHVRLVGNPVRRISELRSVIRSLKPDLVNTTLLFSNLAGRVATRGVRTPVVTTLANQDYGPEHRANSRYGSWSVRAVQGLDMISSPLTVRFHAVSEDVARVMSSRLRISSNRISVVHRGRDPARLGVPSMDRRLRARALLQLHQTAPVVLSVGRLDLQKGIETTIDAFRHLRTRMPDAVLLIAGRPGNAADAVRAEAERMPSIRLLGHRTDAPDLMCAADALSFPSRWEGLSGALVEAMALRLPIVASEIPSVAETIGDVGWPLVQPDDARALADGLLSVLRGGEVNEARKDAGQKRFQRLFTADAAAEGMASLYWEVLREYRNENWSKQEGRLFIGASRRWLRKS